MFASVSGDLGCGLDVRSLISAVEGSDLGALSNSLAISCGIHVEGTCSFLYLYLFFLRILFVLSNNTVCSWLF